MKIRRLVIGTFIATIAVIVSTMSLSLAWYVSNNVVDVNYFQIEMEGRDPDIKISTKPDSEFEKDKYYDLNEQIHHFEPISSANSMTWMENATSSTMPEFIEAYDINNVVNGVSKNVKATKHFYQHEFYISVAQDKPCYVTIDPENSNVFTSEGSKAKNYEAANLLFGKPGYEDYASVDDLAEELSNINKSVRISILVENNDGLNYYVINPCENETTLFGGALDTTGLQEDKCDIKCYDYYLNNNDNQRYEIFYGNLEDRSCLKYKESATQNQPHEGKWTCFNSGHSMNVKALDWEASNAAGLNEKIEKETSYRLSNEDGVKKLEKTPVLSFNSGIDYDLSSNGIKIPILGNGKPAKIIMSVYVEGWDRDNINDVMYASFDVKMAFKKVAKPILTEE